LEAAMLQRLDFWLAVVVLALFAYWELHLDRVINPLVRSIVAVAWPAAKEVAERAKRRLPTTVRLKSRPIRRDDGRFDGSLPAETNRNEDESRFGAVSVIATPEDDTETIAFRFLARLVKAGYVTETQALESACGVKAGSSKAYQEARAKLKKALEDVETPVLAH
jgi:hypothetical protein